MNTLMNIMVLCVDKDGGQASSSIGSVEIEQKYQADSSGVMEFTAGSQTYELNFAGTFTLRSFLDREKLLKILFHQ